MQRWAVVVKEVEPRVAKRYSSDRTAAIKRTKDRSSSTGREAADRLARRSDLFFTSATSAQVFHQLSTRFPHSRPGTLARALGAALLAVAIVAPAGVRAAGDGSASGTAATTYRLFLRDGSSVATIGEFARTGDRVVVTIGLGDRLTMATVPAAQVDWTRTDRYTESIRAAQYAATRGEADFAAMSAVVARTLSDVAVTPGRDAQLALAERARRQLAGWPHEHYGYRADEVRQTLALLDEVIAGLRAATGQTAFDVAFVANVLPTPPEPVLPPPTLKDAIEQALRLSMLAPPGAERTALADEARTALTAASAAPWAGEALGRAERILEGERRVEARYAALSQATVRALDRPGRAYDVAGLLRVRARVVDRDAAFGRVRPEAVQGLLALVDARLDAARRLQLARDQWASRVPALRQYRRDVAPWLDLLALHRPTLDQIRALSGPPIDRLAAFDLALARLAPLLKTLVVPADARGVQAAMLGAIGLAESASRGRSRAIETQDLSVAWEASAAAAGAIQMAERATRDIAALLRPPAEP
jgi:hypothetical protein